jgi:ATPase subunit of ABC transporter with duplicated ATPase domains
VSHDRHFLNQVCTYICDVDFGAIRQYAGNYDFWYQSSQLALQLQKEQNKKAEEKIKELQTFIARFAANAAKSKQATSRKKLLDKIQVEDIRPSSRRYPYIAFTPDREAGDQLLQVEGLSKTVDGEQVLKNVSFTLKKGDKVAFVGPNSIGKTMLFKILMGEEEADEGSFKWGVTTTQAYLPSDNSEFFDGIDLSLVDWLRQYSKDPDETFVRGFLGRMLFSGEEVLKKASVLSGGEKMRCMISRMMLKNANTMILDSPTNHLDLESIQAFNNTLKAFKGNILFSSHDHEFIQTVANRVIELTPNGIIDKIMDYDDYITDPIVAEMKQRMYR